MAGDAPDFEKKLIETARDLAGAGQSPAPEIQKYILETITSQESKKSERSESRFSARFWIVMTALLTGAINFGFEYYRTNHTAEIDAAAKRTQADIDAESRRKQAVLDAEAKRREFEYQLLAKELDGNKTEQQRAEVLLFLAKIGVLSSLNVPEIERIANSHLPADRKVGIPALQSDVRQLLRDQGGEDVSALLSDRAIALIVQWEGMEKSLYDRLKRDRPYVDKLFAGVEIGFAYSLRIVSPEQFRHDWEGIVDEQVLKSLEPAVGLADLEKANEFVASLPATVSIPYEMAQKNMVRTLIVDNANALLERYPESRNLDRDCFGAVLSLYMYNRFGRVRNGLVEAIRQNDPNSIAALIASIDDIGKRRHAQEAALCSGRSTTSDIQQ